MKINDLKNYGSDDTVKNLDAEIKKIADKIIPINISPIVSESKEQEVLKISRSHFNSFLGDYTGLNGHKFLLKIIKKSENIYENYGTQNDLYEEFSEEEINKLKLKCKEDECVVYYYTDLPLEEIKISLQKKIDDYLNIEGNEHDDAYCFSLLFMMEIINNNL